MVATSVLLAAAALVFVAGCSKARFPRPAILAASRLGVPFASVVGRLFAGFELMAGAQAVLWGGRWSSILLACLYCFFAGATGVLRARFPDENCGCLGLSEWRPTPAHIALNLGVAALLGIGASKDPAGLLSLIGSRSARSRTGLAVGVASFALWLVLGGSEALKRVRVRVRSGPS